MYNIINQAPFLPPPLNPPLLLHKQVNILMPQAAQPLVRPLNMQQQPSKARIHMSTPAVSVHSIPSTSTAEPPLTSSPHCPPQTGTPSHGRHSRTYPPASSRRSSSRATPSCCLPRHPCSRRATACSRSRAGWSRPRRRGTARSGCRARTSGPLARRRCARRGRTSGG